MIYDFNYNQKTNQCNYHLIFQPGEYHHFLTQSESITILVMKSDDQPSYSATMIMIAHLVLQIPDRPPFPQVS